MPQRERRKMIFRSIVLTALILARPLAVDAQVVPAAANGITVVGRGVVRVRADELHFSATLFPSPSRVQTAPAPSADVDGAAEAIAKALRDAGVADASAGYPGGFGSLNTTGRTVTGTLHKPTRDGVSAIVKAGNAAAAPYANVTLQNLGLNFSVDDCSAPEVRAQDAALADARARAERAANAAGVRLGAVVAVNEALGLGSAACATRPDSQVSIGQRPEGDAALGDVFITIAATVTYAIAH